jgi:hypothetical protein
VAVASPPRPPRNLPELGPPLVLSAVVATFHVGLYLVIRGSGLMWLPFLWLAALLGAYAGQALGLRLGGPLMVGDFSLLWSSALAWVGIVLVATVSQLVPAQDGSRER